MTEPKKPLPVVLIAAVVIGAAVVGMAVAFGVVAGRAVVSLALEKDKRVTIDQGLAKAAQDVNKTCPHMIDSETRLDNTHAGFGKAFYYRYTLVNLAKADVDPGEVATAMRPAIIGNYKTNPMMKTFRDAGVTMHYQYSDKDGVFITDVVVGPADLKK